MRSLAITLLLLAAGASCPALSQEDGRQQTVTVTASMVDVGDLQAAPAVYRRIPADFVLMEVNFQSGSRDPATRKSELETMFARLKKAVSDAKGYELFGGYIGETSAPIDTVLLDDIYSDRSNQAQFKLTLSVDTKPGETFDLMMRRATAFIDGIKIAGRAEAFMGDEQYLGARGTDKHRNDLLEDIRKEVSDLDLLFQPATVTVGGLESRVITQPSGPLELEIFIPYTLTVKSDVDLAE